MTLAPSTGKTAKVMIAKGTDNEYSNEPMQEVNLLSEGYPRYTVYEITNAAKRYMNNNEVPTFASSGSIPAISRIEYCGGRVIFATAAGSGDTITCATGHYYTVAQFLGATNFSLSRSWKTEDYQLLGDDGPSTALVHKLWEASCDAYWAQTQATLTTSGGNANSHITVTHEPGGAVGNTYDLVLVDPEAENTTADISVSGTTITVTLASTDVPAITTTATQLVGLLNASDAVRALGITAALKAGETGAGVVAALAHPNGHLTGGVDPVDYGSETDKVVLVLYLNDDNDQRYEGYAVIQDFNPNIDAGKLNKTAIKFKSYGPSDIYYRPS